MQYKCWQILKKYLFIFYECLPRLALLHRGKSTVHPFFLFRYVQKSDLLEPTFGNIFWCLQLFFAGKAMVWMLYFLSNKVLPNITLFKTFAVEWKNNENVFTARPHDRCYGTMLLIFKYISIFVFSIFSRRSWLVKTRTQRYFVSGRMLCWGM